MFGKKKKATGEGGTKKKVTPIVKEVIDDEMATRDLTDGKAINDDVISHKKMKAIREGAINLKAKRMVKDPRVPGYVL